VKRKPKNGKEELEFRRKNFKRDKDKAGKIEIGVYKGKDDQKSFYIGRADWLGVLANDLDSERPTIKRCQILRVTIGESGKKSVRKIRPVNIPRYYYYVGPWDENNKIHKELLGWAANRPDPEIKKIVAVLRIKLIKQPELDFEDKTSETFTEAKARGSVQTLPPPVYGEKEKHSIKINKQNVEADLDTIRKILGF
jgi:hypothetical protein